MSEYRFVVAHTPEEFAEISLIHALGWRTTYPDAVPADYMAEVITDDRWIPILQDDYRGGKNKAILMYHNDQPVCCARFGSVNRGSSQWEDYANWGEVLSFYTHPSHTGEGYGSVLMNKVLQSLKDDGFDHCYVLVLDENHGARRFYQRCGFSWDGTHVDIPFPHDVICKDLRYVQALT